MPREFVHHGIGNIMKEKILYITFCLFLSTTILAQNSSTKLKLNDSSYFETRGLNVLVFSNYYGVFNDEKLSGVELIHHGVRTATNGDVRLNPTPEQWDPIPKFNRRDVNKNNNSITAYLSYPNYNFDYAVKAEAKDDGIILSVILDKPLPKNLEGKAGFNLEFLPSAYFEKTFIMDNNTGSFPLYPNSSMELTKDKIVEPEPFASGSNLVLAPEDSLRMVSISSKKNKLLLYDGRNKAQNGWFVVRSVIPEGKTGTVVEWFLKANTIPGWVRKPVIEYSQVGYHPDQQKIAVLEFDKNYKPVKTISLFKVSDKGKLDLALNDEIKNWGQYLRYDYATFDFSTIKDDGLYVIEYDGIKTKPFRISKDVYKNAWHPTLDIYFNVQMDHMFVNEAYRVWHGAAHMDDALQAPVNHEHFDLYAQGPTTDTKYKPGEHIPGLNIGGWFDAGDYDIRTQTQYSVVSNLVQVWEDFGIKRDETTINEKTHFVDMHHPDGVPDVIQQIEHGTLQLLAQFKSVGHALNGIISAHLSQYHHLGDAVTMTDNFIYNPKLDSLETDGKTSGTFDDRWAFTNKSTPLNYGSIAALAAASRALKGYNNDLANECLETAKKVWADEQTHSPNLYHHGNTTGGSLESEELKAAVELLICTKEKKYSDRVGDLFSKMGRQFYFNSSYFVRAIPYMNEEYEKKIEVLVKNYKGMFDSLIKENPFKVLITRGGWAGNGTIIRIAMNNYILHKAFPKIIDNEDVYRGLNYIFGCHPGSSISFVSGVGTVSKKIAYGNNRADFTFIAGGIVPGELIIKPDFPENKEDWPFLWGENEYVVNLASNYIYLVNAVDRLLNK